MDLRFRVFSSFVVRLWFLPKTKTLNPTPKTKPVGRSRSPLYLVAAVEATRAEKTNAQASYSLTSLTRGWYKGVYRGFLKIRRTILGVPIIRIIGFLGSILGSPYCGKLPYRGLL